MILEPDYPHIVRSLPYRGLTIELDQSTLDGYPVYSAWVNYPTGSAMAVPKAWTPEEATRRAKRWIDRRFT
ncbi:MAG: hypothetical protein O3C67_06755 [Cyanobacteria bacterium]|nr:hypothetical protein [Cyanobacteriota bacterium]MEB3267865.1 hypothetical protein [Leptolyngbya sp.]